MKKINLYIKKSNDALVKKLRKKLKKQKISFSKFLVSEAKKYLDKDQK